MTFTPPQAVLLIRNPTAGRRRRGLVDAVVRKVRAAGWTVDLATPSCEDFGPSETCDARAMRVIAVAGGDSTITEVRSSLRGAATGPGWLRWPLYRWAPPMCWRTAGSRKPRAAALAP
jgi:hypothetical protein